MTNTQSKYQIDNCNCNLNFDVRCRCWYIDKTWDTCPVKLDTILFMLGNGDWYRQVEDYGIDALATEVKSKCNLSNQDWEKVVEAWWNDFSDDELDKLELQGWDRSL
jgi:hypothetical protein